MGYPLRILDGMREEHLVAVYDRLPLTVECGRGCYLFDAAGRRYLDMASGIGVNAFGYSNPRITAALTEQAGRCVHTSNLVSHPYQEELARELCRISGLDRAFFSNSGTEAMEAALKAVRSRSRSLDPTKTRLVSLERSFHGRTLGSLSVSGQAKFGRRFEPLDRAVDFIRPNDQEALAAVVTKATAAVILEPVLGEGGIRPLKTEFLRQARELTKRLGALLVADETQCGLGRTGKYFGYQWAGIRPDIVVTAKPLAGGLPLGATLFTEEAAKHLPLHSHGTTFGGGPLACRVALECLRLLEETLPGIADRARQFRSRLDGLARRHSVVTQIRSKGLMFGLELSRPGRPFVVAALERGLLVNCTRETVLRLLPPYIVTRDEIDRAVEILDLTFSAAPAGPPPRCRGPRRLPSP